MSDFKIQCRDAFVDAERLIFSHDTNTPLIVVDKSMNSPLIFWTGKKTVRFDYE